MKKLILWLICGIGTTVAFAQQEAADSLIYQPQDTVIIPKEPLIKFESGVFIEAGVGMTPVSDTYGPMTHLSLGLQYKSLFASFGIHDYKGTYNTTVIFPNNFNLAYRYGAVRLGLRVYDSPNFEMNLLIHYGLGDVVWIRESNDEEFLRDKFDVFKPQFMALFTPIESLKLFATFGYNGMKNLELAYLGNQDFNGITFGFGVRCGIYQQ